MFLRNLNKVHEVFSQSTASNKVKQTENPPLLSPESIQLPRQKIKTKLIPSKKLSTKKLDDMVSIAEWQFCKTL